MKIKTGEGRTDERVLVRELEVEGNEVEESDQAGSQNGSVLEEASGNEWVVGELGLVESENNQENGSDDKHSDDLVAAPKESTAVGQSQGEEELKKVNMVSSSSLQMTN